MADGDAATPSAGGFLVRSSSDPSVYGVIVSNDTQCGAVLADDVARCEYERGHDGEHGACLGYVEEGQDTGDLMLSPGDCLDWMEW